MDDLKTFSEQIDFIHLDMGTSFMMIKVDSGITMSILSFYMYHWFAQYKSYL